MAGLAADRKPCHTGHDSAVASASHGTKVDVHELAASHHSVLADIRCLLLRMAEENSTGLPQGALQNVEHRVGRLTIVRILKAHSISPVPARPMSWRTFLRAHRGAITGADFVTTEVWTGHGLVTFYTVFAIDLATRWVEIVGPHPYPNDLFMRQVSRTLTETDGMLSDHRVLICDCDRKWSKEVRGLLGEAGVRVVQAQNANCPRCALHTVDQGGVSRSDDAAR
jgi:hypothetical protein